MALHVVGQRADGYHLLDSIVTFADLGDRITVQPSEALKVDVSGPMSAFVPDGTQNVVYRTLQELLPHAYAEVHIDKELPVAAGLGGGSADAAAALRLVTRMLERAMPARSRLAKMGADIPVCLCKGVLRVRGVGERVKPLAGWPSLHLVLVNPGFRLATASVFASLRQKENSGFPPLPESGQLSDFVDWLHLQRNDLERTAVEKCPSVETALTQLRHCGCLLARMSGSGPTCFGIFADAETADDARARIAAAEPSWWIRSTTTTGSGPSACAGRQQTR